MSWSPTYTSYYPSEPSLSSAPISDAPSVGLGLVFDHPHQNTVGYQESTATSSVFESPPISLSTTSEPWVQSLPTTAHAKPTPWHIEQDVDMRGTSFTSSSPYHESSTSVLMPAWNQRVSEAYAPITPYYSQDINQSFSSSHDRPYGSVDLNAADLISHHYGHLPPTDTFHSNQRHWDAGSAASQHSGSITSYLSSTPPTLKRDRSIPPDQPMQRRPRQKGGIKKSSSKRRGKHSCPDCGEIFDCKRNLNDHTRSHDRTRKAVHCPQEGCTRTYGRKADLTRHIKSFHDREVYPCLYCGKGFNRTDLRQRHYDICPRLKNFVLDPASATASHTNVPTPTWSKDVNTYSLESQQHNEPHQSSSRQHVYNKLRVQHSEEPMHFTESTDINYSENLYQ